MRQLPGIVAVVCLGLALSAGSSGAGAAVHHRSCPREDRTFAPSSVRIVRSGCIPVSNGHLLERFGDGLPLGAHWPDEGVL